ncbi:TPA: pyruvate ferredoxin oxidoreductase [Candidatus Woesearchaeota archaeon]|nr:pyruvate ferredoxin oxidoreductase [Candidatus Woesearchaeota archaeon]
MKKVTEASQAVAEAVKLCRPGCIPVYPITPQTHIPERISDFVDDGEMTCEMIYVESEHSALSAAIGSSAAGVRTYTATASQGLALMHEILHVVSGMRLPVVMNVANRALSAPINIWNDHQDSMNARDTSWVQLYVESAQEALDTTIQAFRIAEDKDVLLPVMVCLDGFTLSHVYEPVDVPDQKDVDKFLPAFKPLVSLDGKPVTMGPIGYPDQFMGFKMQQEDGMLASLDVIKKANSEFAKVFKRSYGDGLIEPYLLDDADYVFVGLGTVCGTARVVIDKLRKEGIKAGMCKLRTFRPFPTEEIVAACSKAKALLVFDKSFSYGFKGPVFAEFQSAFYDQPAKPVMHSFIAGLGGYDIRLDHIESAFRKAASSDKPLYEWLYDE